MTFLIKRISCSYEPYYFNCRECGAPIMTERQRHEGRCIRCEAEALVAAEEKTRHRPLTAAQTQERVDAIVAREIGG